MEEEGTHVNFVEVGVSPTGLTRIWEVRTKQDNTILAQIKWYPPWRCYAIHINNHQRKNNKDWATWFHEQLGYRITDTTEDEENLATTMNALLKETIFEKTCLRDIANFCENKTLEHRQKQMRV
jgi:hypothetical protein